MATFDPAFDKMIRNEGGFKLTNIEGDRGGQTYAGIAGMRSFDKMKGTDPKLVGR